MRHNARKAALVAAPGLAGWRAVRTATVKKGDIVRREDGTQHTVTGTSYSRPRNQYTIYFAVPGTYDVGLLIIKEQHSPTFQLAPVEKVQVAPPATH